MGLLRIALPLFATVVALAASDNASAQYRGGGIPSAPAWYFGAGGGVSWYDGTDQDFRVPSVSKPGLSDTAIGWKVFAGYRFNPYFGVEGSYVDLGKASGGSNYAVGSWNAAAVGRIPFGSGFFLQGKAGAAYTRAEGFGNHFYRIQPLLGGGVGWDFPSGVTLLGEYEYFGKAGNATAFDATGAVISGTGRAHLNLWSVSGMWRF